MGQLFCITKRGKWYNKIGQVLQSGATFITKRFNHYKEVQYRRQMRERGKGNRFWKPAPSFTLDLPVDRHILSHFTSTVDREFLRGWIFVIIKRMKRSQPHHRRICVTCKLEKQLFRGVSCSENSFTLPRIITVTLQGQLSALDILLQILQEFRNIFLKEHFRKAAPAALLKIKTKGFDLKLSF